MLVKAVQSAWCYLFGAIPRSIWMETGELLKSSVCLSERTGGHSCSIWAFSDFYQTLHRLPDTSDELDSHKPPTQSVSHLFCLLLRGFTVNTAGRTHVFKPVSVQAMW